MGKLPVIIAVKKRPVRNGGGPAGIAYKLIKGLMDDPRFVLYCLSTTEARIWKVASLSDLEAIVLDFYPTPTFRRFRKLLKQFSFVRNLYHFYRYNFSILHPKNLAINREIKNILSGDKGILNLHGVPSPAEITDAFITQRCFPLILIWSEHSKGGLMREMEQEDGIQVRNWLSYKILRRRYSYLVEHGDRIIFPSWGAVDLFEKYNGMEIPRCKLSIIYNGVEDPIEQNKLEVSETSDLFVTVAEHVPEKGLDIALEGLARFKRPWQWYVVGGATHWTDAIVEKAQGWGVLDRIHLVGRLPRQQVLELMAKAKAIILTQRVAVFDLVVIEAMSLGKIILATPVGGNIEALGEDYPFYVKDAEDLSRALEIVAGGDFKEIGTRNRQRYCAHFKEETMIHSYASIYSEMGL